MSGKKGIQETKDLVVFLVTFANALDQALENGWQWLSDLIGLIPAGIKLPAAVTGIEQVPAELDDLDEDERKELMDVVAGLEFNSEMTEIITERAIATALSLASLIEAIRNAK